MNIKIGKHFTFDSSHFLPGSIYGKCMSLHGHTYRLTIEISGKVNKFGWVCNFSELKDVVKMLVIDKFDHQHLNNTFEIPTAEVISTFIYNTISQWIIDNKKDYKLSRVILYETPTSYCEVSCEG